MRKTVEEIVETIKALKGFTNDYEVAEVLKIGSGALSNAKKRNSVTFLDELVMFCDYEKLSLDFIRHDPFASSEHVNTIIAPGYITPGQSDKFLEVGVYSMPKGSDGKEIYEVDPVDTVVIPRELYHEGCMVVRVTGDAMEKLIMDGASAVVDTNVKELISGNVYVFKIPLEGHVVRECHSEPGAIKLRPYNQNYPESRIRWNDFDPSMIVGKISCSVLNVFR